MLGNVGAGVDGAAALIDVINDKQDTTTSVSGWGLGGNRDMLHYPSFLERIVQYCLLHGSKH